MQFWDRSVSRVRKHRGSTRAESLVGVNESSASSLPAYDVSNVEFSWTIGDAEKQHPVILIER